MTRRASKTTVTFSKPFVLGGFDEVLPAGAYETETDEELLEGISFPVYRRLVTHIQLHAKPGHLGFAETLTIEPNELDAAVKRDQAPEQVSVDPEAGQDTPDGATELRPATNATAKP